MEHIYATGFCIIVFFLLNKTYPFGWVSFYAHDHGVCVHIFVYISFLLFQSVFPYLMSNMLTRYMVKCKGQVIPVGDYVIKYYAMKAYEGVEI
jgi:hypothetical protein